MISNKKADMSIQLIIVAAIALIVLIVMIFIFSSKINLFGSGVSNCNGICAGSFNPTIESKGSEICNQESNTRGIQYTYNPAATCPGDIKTLKKACCIQVNI